MEADEIDRLRFENVKRAPCEYEVMWSMARQRCQAQRECVVAVVASELKEEEALNVDWTSFLDDDSGKPAWCVLSEHDVDCVVFSRFILDFKNQLRAKPELVFALSGCLSNLNRWDAPSRFLVYPGCVAGVLLDALESLKTNNADAVVKFVNESKLHIFEYDTETLDAKDLMDIESVQSGVGRWPPSKYQDFTPKFGYVATALGRKAGQIEFHHFETATFHAAQQCGAVGSPSATTFSRLLRLGGTIEPSRYVTLPGLVLGMPMALPTLLQFVSSGHVRVEWLKDVQLFAVCTDDRIRAIARRTILNRQHPFWRRCSTILAQCQPEPDIPEEAKRSATKFARFLRLADADRRFCSSQVVEVADSAGLSTDVAGMVCDYEGQRLLFRQFRRAFSEQVVRNAELDIVSDIVDVAAIMPSKFTSALTNVIVRKLPLEALYKFSL